MHPIARRWILAERLRHPVGDRPALRIDDAPCERSRCGIRHDRALRGVRAEAKLIEMHRVRRVAERGQRQQDAKVPPHAAPLQSSLGRDGVGTAVGASGDGAAARRKSPWVGSRIAVSR